MSSTPFKSKYVLRGVALASLLASTFALAQDPWSSSVQQSGAQQQSQSFPGPIQQEWPGYDAAMSNVHSIYQKLMVAKRKSNTLGARSEFDAAAQVLIKAMDEIKDASTWNYGLPSPHTVAALHASKAVAAAAVQATRNLDALLGPRVRFITISEFFKTIQWAYDVDTGYYRAVASNPYGDFPKSYFDQIQNLGKLFLDIQNEIGTAMATNSAEIGITMEVAKAVRYILAMSVFRRALEGVGYQLLYVEQICAENSNATHIDPWVMPEIRSRMQQAARMISGCAYSEYPNYPSPSRGRRDYHYPGFGYGPWSQQGGRSQS